MPAQAKRPFTPQSESSQLTCPACGAEIPVPELINATVEGRVRDRNQALLKAEATLRHAQAQLALELEAKDESNRAELQKARVQAEKQIAQKVAEALKSAQDRQKASEEQLRQSYEWEKHLLGVQLAEVHKGKLDLERRTQKELLKLEGALSKAQFDRESAVEEGKQAAQKEANARVSKIQLALEKSQNTLVQRELEFERRFAQATKEAELRVWREAEQKHKAGLAGAMASERQRGKADAERELLGSLREREAQIQELRLQMDELRLKAQEGSSERKGRVAEDGFEAGLREAFLGSGDQLLKTKRGQKGGDFQLVIGEAGRKSILLEVKSTQNFEKGWLRKAKEDRNDARADHVVIVSKTLPPGIELIGQCEEVWISSFDSAIPLLRVLRQELIHVDKARRLYEMGDAEYQALKTFLGGPQFKTQVECIVAMAAERRKELLLEKGQHERMWTQQERAIEKTLASAIRIWVEMDDRSGGGLPESKVLAPFLTPTNPSTRKPRRRGSEVA